MKRISIFLYVLLFILASCEKDENRVILKSDATPPRLTAPAASAEFVINPTKLDEQVEFTWEDTDYGVNTEVTYTIEVDSKCNAFANPIAVGTTTSSSLPITMDIINEKLLNDLKLAPHQIAELQFRITSVINNKYKSISELVSVSVTPWSDKRVALWIGENSVTAPKLYTTGSSKYEGYRYLEKGTSFRFSNNTICADSVYGITGAPGELSFGATSTEIEVAESGFYKINVDTKNLKYEMILTHWGMIGTATPGGWGSSTPFEYDTANDVWQSEIALVAGALKFRANDGWSINYGTNSTDALSGDLAFDAPAINIAEPGNYIVKIDFTQSKSTYAFTYSVAKSSNIPEPAKLWLPGSYQNWKPDLAPTIYAVNSVSYEGYVYIPVGAGFKFTSAPDWDHINYGDSGTEGLLTTDGTKDGLSLNTGGYYRFIVNTSTLEYKIDLVNTMDIVGPATLGGSDDGWLTSIPMTYNQTDDVWSITYNLSPGAIKFRANNGWAINYGPADSNALEGTIIFDSQASVNITEAGSYTITADFSRSTSPYKYIYTIKKN